VEPDIITAAKGLANGQPVGLTIARPEIADRYDGLTISTFGGNPVTCVAAKAVIDIIEEDDLRTNAAVVGGYFREKLEALKDKHKLIGDVRGMGLMQAIELVEDRNTKVPATSATAAMMEETRKRGLLVGRGGMWSNVLRMSPPLNISKQDVDEADRILDESLDAIEQGRR
jgi:4-aminobutyrate aminotransferase-like enzyme